MPDNLALGRSAQKEIFYKEFLNEYSSSSFEDNIWIIDRCYLDKNEKKIVSFEIFNIDSIWLTRIKIWVVKLLMNERTLGTIRAYLIRLNTFFNHFSSCSIDKKYIYRYSQEISNNQYSNNELRNRLSIWETLKQFFYDLELWDLYEATNRAVVPFFPRYQRSDQRLIDPFVLSQLDEAFSQEELPNIFRGIYWSLRLIPNRITEVLSIKPDCLQETECGSFLLTVPQFKQTGPFNFSESKVIELIPEGIVLDYVGILKKQQKRYESFPNKTGFLFTDHIYRLDKRRKEFKPEISYPKVYSRNMVNRIFKRVIDYFDIKDKNGNSPYITSHMLRHNNINDRIESGLFTSERIQTLSGHKSLTMLEKAYIHPSLEETAKSLESLKTEEDSNSSFRGRILEPERLKQIENRPFAHSLGNLGVCSDIRQCRSGSRNCLACSYFSPGEASPDKLKRELKTWQKKKRLAESTGDSTFAKTCNKIIKELEALPERIESEMNNV